MYGTSTLKVNLIRFREKFAPLTITDNAITRAALEHIFKKYGLPWAIRSDNGFPFAIISVGGLSRLSIYWIKLEITPEWIEPCHPEQNPRHERPHEGIDMRTPGNVYTYSQREFFEQKEAVDHDEKFLVLTVFNKKSDKTYQRSVTLAPVSTRSWSSL